MTPETRAKIREAAEKAKNERDPFYHGKYRARFDVMLLLDNFLALLDEVERHQWRPIETAPRDGTEIQVSGPHVTKRFYVETSAFYRDRWLIEWMEGYGTPTHWTPLLAPPTNGEG